MYKRTEQNIWSGRSDREEGTGGLRWHEIIQILDTGKINLPPTGNDRRGIALLGFNCDEGVRRNKGRPGATGGPDAIRRVLAGLPVHFKDTTILFDGGNVSCINGDLETASDELSQIVADAIKGGYFPIVMGGGHEMAWGTFRGIMDSGKAEGKVGIINLDAHFDLRKPSEEGASSGTPFYQIAEWHRAHGLSFKYFVAGIQQMSNTRALFTRARKLGTTYVTREEIENDPGSVRDALNSFIDDVDQIYLTICLDVFNSAFAPGVSAPNPLGIRPGEALRIIDTAKACGKIIAADIAEMNPRFDIDQRTARLAAALIFELTCGFPPKKNDKSPQILHG